MSRVQKVLVWIFTRGFFKIWYRIVNKLDKKAEVVFLNYGYEDGGDPVPLASDDEPHRYPIQLYEQLVRGVELANKDLLEIGCGRGGGLSYLAKKFKPHYAVGIDRDPNAIGFCNKQHQLPGLKFFQGDAMRTGLPDNSFDVIINVESCHLYERMDLFLSEVFRLLKPGGLFLLTDFRNSKDIAELIGQLDDSGLQAIGSREITESVLRGLELDDSRRRGLIHRLVPAWLRWIAKDFSGVKGSPTFRKFASREWVYYNFVRRKNQD